MARGESRFGGQGIRLDAYEVKVVLKDKAILRHHISITCNAEVEHAEA